MDITTVFDVLGQLMTGGPKGIIVILAVIIACLLWDRARILKEISDKNKRMDDVVDLYYKSSLTLAESLDSLKIVLLEIKEHVN